MSQQNFKKQSNTQTFIPEENYLALFYSTELDAWAYKNENGDVLRFVSETTKARSIFARVKNESGATIPVLSAVFVNGSSGLLPTIQKAQANSSLTSDKTFAVLAEGISDGAESSGAIVQGLIEDIDTSAFSDGDLLWLSPLVAGGLTTTKPVAPDHSVFIGYVIKAHPTQGSIEVNIKNGFQIGDLHDVLLSSIQNKDILKYDSASQTWKNGTLTKSEVGLANVDNTSDANKPVSTAQQAALDLKVNLSSIGAANGVAPLGVDSKVPASFLPSYVDDVLEFANLAAFPVTGETGKIYVALDTNKTYRWTGSVYTEISASPGSTDAVPEGSLNKYFTESRVLATVLTGLSLLTGTAITAADSILSAMGKLQKQISDNLATLSSHIGNLSNPHAVTKTQVGLSNVPNIDTSTTTNITEGTNLFFTAARVLSTVLTGFAASTNTAVAATDTILQALQKLQAQVSAREPSITAGTTAQYWRGDKTFQDLATAVRAVVLTGLTFPYDTGVTAADSILSAIGKLQGQIDVWTEIITTADVTNASNTTPTNVTELAVPVVAGRAYRYELTAVFESAQAVNGFSVTVNSPDGAVGTIAMTARMIFAADGGGAEYGGAITTLGDLVSSTAVPVANTRYVCTVIGMFVCTTGGTIQPQIRRTSGTGGQTVTLRAGSCLLVREFQ